jgi:hypothetical protein
MIEWVRLFKKISKKLINTLVPETFNPQSLFSCNKMSKVMVDAIPGSTSGIDVGGGT